MRKTRAAAESKRCPRKAEFREYDQMRHCQTNGHRSCVAAVDGDSVSAAEAAAAGISNHWESTAATTSVADCAVHYTAHVTYNAVHAP